MQQQKPLLELAVGQSCQYCGFELEPEGPRQPTREHVKSRSAGGRLHGHGRAIVCRQCNLDKSDLTLLEFMLKLIREADDRAPYVCEFAVDAYLKLAQDDADALVGMPAGVKPKRANKGIPRKCLFPHCACARDCMHSSSKLTE